MRLGDNSVNAKQLAGYLKEIDKADADLAKLQADHMARCKPIRQHLKDIMETAKDAGLNMRAFRALVAEHRDERRIEERIANLEADDRHEVELMRAALGDYGETPLGKAAIERAEARAQ